MEPWPRVTAKERKGGSSSPGWQQAAVVSTVALAGAALKRLASPRKAGKMDRAATLAHAAEPGPAAASCAGPDRGGSWRPGIRLYTSSVTPSPKARKETLRMRHLLEAKRIPYEEVDVAEDPAARRRLYASASSAGPTQLPQLHAEEEYIGVYEEVQELEDFAELDPRLKSPARLRTPPPPP